MRYENGLFVETADAVKVLRINESTRVPEGSNVTIFVELIDSNTDMKVILPKPERSPIKFVSVIVNLNSEDDDVTIDEKYLRQSTDITLNAPGEYVLLFCDGFRWNVVNYYWA